MYESKISNGELEAISSGSIVVQDPLQPISLKLDYNNKFFHEFIFKFTVLEENSKDSGKIEGSLLEMYKQEIAVQLRRGVSYTLIADGPLATAVNGRDIYLGMKIDSSVIGDIFFAYTVMLGKSKGNKIESKEKKA